MAALRKGEPGHQESFLFQFPAERTGLATHIAKLNHETNLTLVRNEFWTLCLAREVLGRRDVTEFELGGVEELNEQALLVERFDRTQDGRKLRLEDLAQVLSRPRLRDFSGKYDGSYEEVAKTICAYSARPLIDLDRFFRRVVFCALVGNCDAHLKNFSLLERPEGLRLSPAYDLIVSGLYPEYSTRFALAICGDRVSYEKIDRKLVWAFGQEIDLKKRAIELAIGEIRKAIEKCSLLEPPSGEDPDGFGHRIAAIVQGGCARILEA